MTFFRVLDSKNPERRTEFTFKEEILMDIRDVLMTKGYVIIQEESDAQDFAGRLIWEQIPFGVVYDYVKDTTTFVAFPKTSTKIQRYRRWLTKRCMDCGVKLSREYARGDVCQRCFDHFNGLIFE